MYLLILFLPLFAFVSACFFGRWLGPEGAKRITTTSLLLSFLLSTFAFYEVGLAGAPTYLTAFTWMDSETFHCSWGFLFDSLSVTMLVVVTSVSTLVHLYSTEYMGGDPHLPRFMSYLSLFTFFMIILVTADNFIQLFLGWEGVGLSSFLLINFWFTRIQANKAAIKAMVINRIGDFGLALGIFGLFGIFKSVDYATVFAMAPLQAGAEMTFLHWSFDAYTLVCILLFVGSMGKSAQLGLHTWLPDAMEGPTPVSALIHAATMVTAGVFLLARCSPLFEYAPKALVFVTFIGAMTAFFAATTGLLQNDLKRVIAYSTCSQLGYMVFACGLSNYAVGIFHLGNHAFFKALLFLGAGSLIHAMGDEQDMRKMGGLRRVLPYTYAIFLIGSLALMGFPFLTGFYSKDLILELAYAKYTLSGHFAHWLGCLAAFFTAFYSFRLLSLAFLSETNAFKAILSEAHEPTPAMSFPLACLAIGSLFTGYWSRDMVVGLGTDFWGNAIYTSPENMMMMEAEFLPTGVKLVPLIFSLSGAFSSYILYAFFSQELFLVKVSAQGRKIYTFLNGKWFFDKVYNDYILQPALKMGYHFTYKAVDRGLIELMGPYGLSHALSATANNVSKLQSGYIYHYTLAMVLGLFLFIKGLVSGFALDPRVLVIFLLCALLFPKDF